MAGILIKNGRVWDGFRFLDADILTDGEKIAKIAPQIPEDKAAFVYDAAGQIVSAGLVDAHVHMRVTPGDEYGIQAEMSCFPFGVTAAADAGRIHGDCAVLDSFMLKNVVFVSADICDNKVDFGVVEQAIAHFGERVAGIKVYFDHALNGVSDSTCLKEICCFAKRHGLPVMVHCSNSPVPMAEILEILNPGDILTHVFHGGVNTAAEDDFACIKKAKKKGVVIDAGFAGHVHTDFSILQRAADNGVFPDTVSTDITKRSAYVRGGRYGMTMCMSMAKHMGMSEEAIFKAVTSTPAAALGKREVWGCLKEGGAADIAVLKYGKEGFCLIDRNGNRMESETGYRCVLTIADGQIIYKD